MAEQTRTTTRDFFSDVVEQLKKVTWPDRAQLLSSTGIIVVFMLLMAAVIFGIDTAVRVVLDAVRSVLGAG